MRKKNVLIIGAGSIGNHLAYSCRQKKWHVSIFDVDKSALKRTKEIIYPSRYGIWDSEVKLSPQMPVGEYFDLVIIGTPPDKHVEIAHSVLSEMAPKVVLVEKPLCPPDMNGLSDFQSILNKSSTTVLVGYNHNLTSNTKFVENLVHAGSIGNPLSMHVRWLEHWGGIFNAHPWLDGPQDSYLGYSKRGGGACAEHSHAISIWRHFSNFMGCGKIKEISANMIMFEDDGLNYDETTILSLKSENGLIGSIIQDVVTEPSQKNLRIQGSKGFVEWHANYDVDHDAVIYGETASKSEKILIPKTRPDDFTGEIDHIDELIDNRSNKSPIGLESGIDCIKVIASAFESNRTGARLTIDY